jgi:hypothetical protein
LADQAFVKQQGEEEAEQRAHMKLTGDMSELRGKAIKPKKVVAKAVKAKTPAEAAKVPKVKPAKSAAKKAKK